MLKQFKIIIIIINYVKTNTIIKQHVQNFYKFKVYIIQSEIFAE